MIYIKLVGDSIFVSWIKDITPTHGPHGAVTFSCCHCGATKRMTSREIRLMLVPFGKELRARCSACGLEKDKTIFVEEI